MRLGLVVSKPSAISGGRGLVSAPMADGRIDVAVGILAEEIPDGGTGGIFKCDPALGLGGFKKEGKDGVLADVFGNVFLGVIRPHLFLVDVFLEDVAEDVGIDFVFRPR